VLQGISEDVEKMTEREEERPATDDSEGIFEVLSLRGYIV